ncbi:MAG: SIS domain-containing protein [Bacteroidetes bacterium]|nr:SIS domain-containing protein [Bacteroidota bacterium]MBU1721062.1 SIS domain-containing protein [Bacteroidota bacterium]
MKQRIADIINKEADSIRNIPVTEAFSRAIEIIHNRVHIGGGKVVTSGMGKAGQIALNIATTFSSTGTPAVFLHASEAQHGDLGVVQKNDILLLISNSGKTREVVELIRLVKQLYENIPAILITGNPETELAQSCDVAISTGNPPEVCPLGLTPTASTTTMNVIGDILIVCMMDKIGFTSEDYARRHHGGYLGEKLKK